MDTSIALPGEKKPKDMVVVKAFENVIHTVAIKRMKELNENYWPNGTANPNLRRGSQTAQGLYADDPLIPQWYLSGRQKYINASCQLMDYNQVLNPGGKSYLTGMGFDPTEDLLHQNAFPMKEKAWEPAPGLQVFGPGNQRQLKKHCPVMIPANHSLPAQCQYPNSWRDVSTNEFNIPESLAYLSVIYTILSMGGTWDRKTDPFKNSTILGHK